MLSHTLKNSSSPPIPAGYKVNDDISQNNSESSALTSEINFVGNSRQALSIQKNTSIPLTDGFLTRTWRSLQASDGEHSRGNISDEEGTELTEILTMGETLRQQANSLCAPSNEAPVPLAWKGSILKRCLVGVGFLTGAGVLGGAGYAGYKYYNARAANTGAPGKGLQPGALHTTLEAVKMQESYGGSLEDSFGHHALHHDASTNRTRHNRRHQPESAYNTTESKLNDDGSKNNVKSTLQKKNHRVKKLLRSAELLSDQIPVPKEKMLYAVSLYLHYNDADINNERNIKLLAQEILSGSGIYGENKNEKLSTEQAKSVVRHWVFQNILGSTPEKYVESRMKMDISKSYTVNDIHRLLPVDTLPVVSSFYPERLSQFEQLFLSIMWKNLLIEEMPFLIFSNKKIISMPLNSFDFANLYSGSRFIKDIKGENVTSEETISTGESIWDLAISEGISEDKLKYYRTPAILFYATVPSGEIESEQVNDINIINNYLNYRTEIDAIKKDIDKKYNTYLSATKLWLSKGELADKIIAHCPNLKQLLNDRINAALTSEQRKEESRKTAKQYYLNGWGKPCDFAPDNIDDNYTQSTTNVANGFREIDKYLILSGINTISENELEFISSPKAIIHLARLVINTSSATRFIINSDTSKEIDIPLNNADLFSVQQDDQERIYTLQKTEDSQKGYRLIRIDRNITEYIINDIFHEDFKKEYIYHSPYVKIKENNFNELYRFIKEPITIKIDNIKSIVDSLSNIHRIALFNNLYESGNDRSDLEKVWSVVKQIIPFYYCIEQSIEGNNGEAVPACLMDIISLVPVAGQASELGGKFAMGLGRGFLSGAVSLSKEGIKATGKNILRGIAIPTTAELASLGKSTLISLDPGFSLLMSTSSVSRTFAEKIVNFIHGKKEMTALAKSLDTRISKLPLITPDKQVVGILPGTELEIPVAAIGKQDGKSIYVKINPETGEKFGDKFVCLNNGMLATFSSVLNRNKRSDENIYISKSINIDANDTSRVRRAGNSPNLCSEQPSTSRASQTNTIMNPSSDMLLRNQGESTIEWAHRLLQLKISTREIARITGISRSQITKWPEYDKIRKLNNQIKLDKVQNREMAVQLMSEKSVLTHKDLVAISKQTGVPVRTLSSMDEYKSKKLNNNQPTVQDKEKAREMLMDGYSIRKISLATGVSERMLFHIKKKWRDIGTNVNTSTVAGKEDTLLKELRELRKSHNTDLKIAPPALTKIINLLSSATENISSFAREITTIAIGVDNKNKFYISSSSEYFPSQLKNWAADNNIHIIKSNGHAEESLINAVPDIVHIEPSHDICLECEFLLLKNNIGTSRPFSHKLSKNRKMIGHYSAEVIDHGRKLKAEFDSKKKQQDEAKILLTEGKLSLIDIERRTGVVIGTLVGFREHETWKILRQQAKAQDPRIKKAIQLHQQGKNQREIAKELGTSMTKVSQWIRRSADSH